MVGVQQTYTVHDLLPRGNILSDTEINNARCEKVYLNGMLYEEGMRNREIINNDKAFIVGTEHGLLKRVIFSEVMDCFEETFVTVDFDTDGRIKILNKQWHYDDPSTTMISNCRLVRDKEGVLTYAIIHGTSTNQWVHENVTLPRILRWKKGLLQSRINQVLWCFQQRLHSKIYSKVNASIECRPGTGIAYQEMMEDLDKLVLLAGK